MKRFICFRVAGLVCICIGLVQIHFAVRRPYWSWGPHQLPECHCFGFGPLALVTWVDD